VAFVQSPGLLVADTKFDLAVDPAGFLGRAVFPWDPSAAFGQMQNQAYGYLWPMGPFFLLGSLVDLPGWVVQRLWMALVLSVAFAGTAKLARAFGVRSDGACLLAGFAFAFSPRMLTTVGPISSEAWASALAPWVLLPLVVGAERGSARRYAALSALAVAMVGGINAAAAFAVLPLGVLWVLTRAPGPRRRALMVWWPAMTALGTLWWLVPLVVLGMHSPPFLDFIESASTTTFTTAAFDALRGTSHWVAYLDPTWRTGNDLLREFWYPLNSGVVLTLGLVGITRRATPHRLFLGSAVLLGLVLLTAGHTGAVQGWAAADVQALLDGVLAPLRNVHKFDPVVRIPLVLGLAVLVEHWLAGLRESSDQAARSADTSSQAVQRLSSAVLVGTAVAAVFGASLPALAGRLAPSDGIASVPEHWTEAAHWLADRAEGNTALLIPGSSFGSYSWGFPRDEPLQWSSATPWAVRNAVPLASAGNIRMLDAVEERLAQGRGSAGLTAYLRRAGVGYLVLRNDLRRSGDVPDSALVRQALGDSPGIRKVAEFGPIVGGDAHLTSAGEASGRTIINGGWQTRAHAVEIYRVGVRAPAAAVAAQEVPLVVGGPEDLLDLADLGLLGDAPTELAVTRSTAVTPDRTVVLTDGLRAAERHFGRVHDAASATLGPGDARRLGNPTRDYLMDDNDRWSASAVLVGAAAVSASSSQADADTDGVLQRGRQPYAAVDGHLETAWAAHRRTEPGWWQIRFDGARPVRSVRLTAGPGEDQVVRVRTADASSRLVELPAGVGRSVSVGSRDSTWLRVEDASGRPGNRLSLAEVDVLGVAVRRPRVLPSLPASWGAPDAVVLRTAHDARAGCVTIDRTMRCVADRAVASEEPFNLDRRVRMATPATYAPALRVRLRPGKAAEELLTRGLPVAVDGSTREVGDLRTAPLAAVDGDLGTAWLSAVDDLRPTLTLSWLGQQDVTGLRLWLHPDVPARLPTRLQVVWPGGSREAEVRPNGRVRLVTPIRTDRLRLEVREAEPGVSLGFDGIRTRIPVGLSEVNVTGVPFVPVALGDTPVTYPCGTGPRVRVGGSTWDTSVTAAPRDLYDGQTAEATLCSAAGIHLPSGETDVMVTASETFVPASLILQRSEVVAKATQRVTVEEGGALRVTLRPPGGDWRGDAVGVRRNANTGWKATQDDSAVDSFIADGWQQGWLVDQDGGPVSAAFVPDRWFSAGLVAGGLTLLLLLVVTCQRESRWADVRLPSLRERSGTPAVMLAGAVVGGGLVAGWGGALVAALALGSVALLAGTAPEAGRWCTAALLVPAALAYAAGPWGDVDGWAGSWAWPPYFVVASVCSSLGWLAVDRGWRLLLPRPRRAFFSRIAGSSTRRKSTSEATRLPSRVSSQTSRPWPRNSE
jgi:arabinofuranan 3-O-arabinosyltransferase